MSFSTYVTDKAGLQKFYEAVIGSHETYAPVEKFGKYDFKKVASPFGVRSRFTHCEDHEREASVLPEIGEDHEVHGNQRRHGGVAIPPGIRLPEKRVILGVKHCDARGLQVLDKVYKWDYIDTDYQKRSENTVIISTRCDKADTHCFCTSLDYDVENLDALDVAVVTERDRKGLYPGQNRERRNLPEDQ